MKLGKKAQYALLFVLYLMRSGRARTVDASGALNISSHFLEQVARRLRQADIIKSVRGPGGGYEMASRPTIGQVLEAVGVQPLLTPDETARCASSGSLEYRVLGEIVGGLSASIRDRLKLPVREFAAAIAEHEGAMLASLNQGSVQQ